jgi:type IV pilus assembly protein PilC
MDFTYTAVDPRGGRVSERVQAENDDQALRRLQNQGLVVLSLEPAVAARSAGRSAKSFVASFGLARTVKLEQIVVISRELAIMMETGVPIVEALEALQQHAGDRMVRQALGQAHADLSQGKTIAQAMAAQPQVFPSVYVSMVRTAETGGSLDETLNQAAEYLESSLEMRRKVTGALTYPAVLMVVAIGVVIFMMTYLLPRFGPLFTHMGAQIPASTRIMLDASAFLVKHWWTIPVTLIGTVWGFRTFALTALGRNALTRLAHRTPGIGDVVKKVALARMLRALGTLSGAGVSLLLALEMAGQTAQDVIFEAAISQIRQNVEQGVSLAEAVIKTGAFPPIICQMMAVGEKSGRLSDVLLRVAKFFERDVDARLKTLSAVIEPFMIVFLGLIIGFIAISIISPIYCLVGSVK